MYPNTYFVEKNTAAKEVVKLLLGEFENQLNQNNIPYDDLYRTVTVASLLQRVRHCLTAKRQQLRGYRKQT